MLVVLFVSFLFAAGTVLPLIHESFVFLGAPGLLILLTALIQNSPENQHLRGVRIAFVILVILGFVVAALFKGDADHALKIWNSLSESDRLRLSPDAPWRPFGAIMAIGYTLLHGVAGIAVILSGNFWLWVFIAVSVFLIVGLITACIEPEEPTRAAALFSFLLLLILASLPMYLIGEDWGRWITAVSISYLSLMYALRSGPQPSIAPGILDPMVRWSTPIMAKAVQHRTALLWLAILYSLTFSYPECCLGVGKKVNPLSAAHKAAQNIYRSLAPGASWVGRPSR